MRHVRGVLFLDYVRMLRSQKNVDWSVHLQPEDLPFLQMKIDPDAWYPMPTFERMGNAILATVTRGEMFPVRLWGRFSATQLVTLFPRLMQKGDPVAVIGSTGRSTGTHVHFEVLRDGNQLNPAKYLAAP